jgi:hypothetical protein
LPLTAAILSRLLADFLKSRVYAKLLMRLILERYQTFDGRAAKVELDGHDNEAYQIGK